MSISERSRHSLADFGSYYLRNTDLKSSNPQILDSCVETHFSEILVEKLNRSEENRVFGHENALSRSSGGVVGSSAA